MIRSATRVAGFRRASLVPVALLLAAGSAAQQQDSDPLRVLFLSKSSGFEHSSIRWPDGEPPSHVEAALQAMAGAEGFELVATKDASLINPGALGAFDVVAFYTTGDLTQAGKADGTLFGGDGQPPMSPDGVEHLLDWVRAGGGFVGFHSASDTFRGGEEGVTPYVGMLGGEFRIHGQQFVGTVRVVDPDHPTVSHLPAAWPVHDEWYLFRHLDREAMHVLALLDPGEERAEQPMYDIPSYPVIWCKTLGEGRIYYNALGHREEVWDDPIFRRHVGAVVRWAAGHGPAQAEPNFADVVPTD